MTTLNTFGSRGTLKAGGDTLQYYSLPALERAGFPSVSRLPYSLKILLENLLRCEDGRFVKADDITALASWDPAAKLQKEIAFTPARVLLQDFTGVPAVVDLAAMRDGIVKLGGDPKKVNPLQPVELVIDHSVQVDYFGQTNAFDLNGRLEYQRNKERYEFLRWGQNAFSNFRVVPPETGIVHQVNLEYLARVICRETREGVLEAFPDTLVGTDSHTTMVNGLGVVGWGVGGIEAEACMLGQPISMLIPEVLGVRLVDDLPEGATATDLVLTVTETLRKLGVVGKFVEFYGPGLASLTIADRATLGNMSPEYGATIAIFPVDEMTLDYLRLTGRPDDQVALVERYTKEQGLFRTAEQPDANYAQTIEIDLASIEPSLAGPRRPQDRVTLKQAKPKFQQELAKMLAEPRKNVPAPDRSQSGAAATSRQGRGRVERRGGRRSGRQRGERHGSRGGGGGGDHELHEHLEPERDDRRGPAREEGGRKGPDAQAVGQDEPRARIAGRHRVSRQGRPHAVSRAAWLQSRRLRLHDLHRQQRTAAGGDRQRHRRAQSGRRVGAERQPQLRRPHPAAGARELPRVAAAGRGVRDRRSR